MIKASFKKDSKKIEVFNNKTTVVTLVGELSLPGILGVFPNKVAEWIREHPSVAFSWKTCTELFDTLRIEVSGRTTCADEDAFDSVIGERIAEAKAKIKIYRFMNTLLNMLYESYGRLFLGDMRFLQQTPHNDCILRDLDVYHDLLIKERRHLVELIRGV